MIRERCGTRKRRANKPAHTTQVARVAVAAILILPACSTSSVGTTNNPASETSGSTNVSTSRSTITSDKTTVTSDGIDQAILIIQLKNQNGEAYTKSGDTVTIEVEAGVVSDPANQGNGTYTATYKPHGTGNITLTPTVNGEAFDNPLTITTEANNGFYIDTNGVTIRCDSATDGATATLKQPGQQATPYTKRTTGNIDTANAATTCTSGVTNMDRLFDAEESFDGTIGHWDTSSVTNMRDMFLGASEFNQPIGNWDTSNVTNMKTMFALTNAFNQDISHWDTSNVNDMHSMFLNANSFNQPIGDWNTSNVTDMDNMFRGAVSFDQDLSGWDPGCATVTPIETKPTDFDTGAGSVKNPTWDDSSCAAN